MPGGRRTDRISKRDLEVLEFVARYGLVPRDVVGLWAQTRRSVTAAREKRLRDAGLLEVLEGFGDSGRLCMSTRDGLRVVGCSDLPPAPRSAAQIHHLGTTARIGAQLELLGHSVLSEREIEARERSEDERFLSANLSDGRFHRPDLIVLDTPPEAIEVELSDKSAHRLDEILRAWQRALLRKRFARVRYLCSARALPYLKRAVRRTDTRSLIDIEPLGPQGERLALRRIGDRPASVLKQPGSTSAAPS